MCVCVCGVCVWVCVGVEWGVCVCVCGWVGCGVCVGGVGVGCVEWGWLWLCVGGVCVCVECEWVAWVECVWCVEVKKFTDNISYNIHISSKHVVNVQ